MAQEFLQVSHCYMLQLLKKHNYMMIILFSYNWWGERMCDCLMKDVVYQVTVKADNETNMRNVGTIEKSWKQRF